MRSLQGRLAAGLGISLVLLLWLQWWLVGISFQTMLEQQLANRLAHDAESLLAGLSFTPESRPAIDRRRVSAVYERPFSGRYYVVRANGFEESSRSLWDARLTVADQRAGDKITLELPGPEKQRLFVLVAGYQKQATAVSIAVAEDLAEQRAGLARFKLLYGAVSVMVLLVLLVVQRWILRRGIQPLNAMRRELVRLERGETERIEVQTPLEVAPLVRELNRLLAVSGNRTRRSRAALGNLAHALNTQLAILAQIAARPELHLLTELRRALEQAIERSRRIVERELRRARIVGAAMPSQRLPLAEEVAAMTQTMRKIYAAKPLVLTADVVEGAVFEGDREDFLELLGNLLDNACKWCRQQVAVTVSPAGGLTLQIEDDGPGCDKQQLEELTRRGFRADESKPGSGLGLAIAADVIDGYGGSLRFGRSRKLGGLQVEVMLPNCTQTSLPDMKGDTT